MNVPNMLAKGAALVAAAILFWGCSKASSDAPALDASGKHPAGWITQHGISILNDQGQCAACHGSDLRGGIARVSCFSDAIGCHPVPPFPHLAGWVAAGTGGAHPAMFVAVPAQCEVCHGSDLRGGIVKVSCFSPLFGGLSCHANGPSGHPAGWRDPALHGAAAKSQPSPGSGFSACQGCHGADFAGGVAGVSCFTAERPTGACHVRNGAPVGAPHAPLPWRSYPAPTHTGTVDDAAGLNAAACALCHTAGNNLRTPILASYATGKPGCFNSTLCHGTMNHPPGWAQPKNHGQTAMANLAFCQQCHADNPLGGPGSNPRFNVRLGRLNDAATGATGCEVCHAPLAAHPRVLQVPPLFGTITTLNPIGTPWYLHCKVSPSGFDACTRCHGANLDGGGGAAGATACTFCHRSGLPNTLKNCTSCHARPPGGIAYPDTAFAHPRHAAINVADVCGECHLGLGSVTLDHFLRARNRTASIQPGAVQFGAFARTGGVNPLYAEANRQCTNVYCHGATLAGGADKAPVWSDASYLTAAGCGTCHGFPPPNGVHAAFTPATPCKSCHPHVNAGNTDFDDPTKHVNGAIDVVSGAAHVFPYPGAVHLSAAGAAPFPGCVASACHVNGSAGKGVYPVAAGTPPNCQGCHTKAGPGNSCGSCHGSAANGGRPNGPSFPDVAGHHISVGAHAAEQCATCHGTNGSGQTSHGPSNRSAHSAANVVVVITQWNAGTRTCSGFSCHGKNHGAGNVW